MTVTVMKARFRIPGLRSLKERRSLVSTLKARLLRDFGVSVCQIPSEGEDDPRFFELGLALAASDTVVAHRETERIREFLAAASEEGLASFESATETW